MTSQIVIYSILFDILFQAKQITSEILGCSTLIIFGLMMCMLNSNLEDPDYTTNHLMKLFIRFDAMMTIGIIYIIFILYYFIMKSPYATINENDINKVAVNNHHKNPKDIFSNQKLLFKFSFQIIILGILSGLNSLVCKSFIEILYYELRYDEHMFTIFMTFILSIISVLLCTIPKHQYMTSLLSCYHPLLLLPCTQVSYDI